MKKDVTPRYSENEERLNILTHGFGLMLSIIGFPFLMYKSFNYEGFWKPLSIVIYGFSLIILYAASTFYHAAIYVLIAGSYSPFTLIILQGSIGWIVFWFTWLFALTGIILKIFYTGRFDKLSTIIYVLMGWQIVFVIKPLIENLATEGMQLLFAGGVFYTIGAIIYSIKKIKFNHAIFHVFVLLGSFCHFASIYLYIN